MAILGQCAAQGVTLYLESLKGVTCLSAGWLLSGDSKEPPLC